MNFCRCWVLAVFFVAAAHGQTSFEIVETVPVETDLDSHKLRDTLDVWLAMIGGAGKTIDVEQFYVSGEKGELLEKVIEALFDAAKRGVAIRFIADAKFHKTYPEILDRLDTGENITVRIIDFGSLTNGGVQHAKFFIVDREEVYLGSANFDWRALKHIREIGVRFRHSRAAACFTDLFELDWQLCETPGMEVKPLSYKVPFCLDDLRFTPIFAPQGLIPDRALWNLDALINLIGKAREEVRIQLLSYSPIHGKDEYWPDLDNALRSAATRGVKVRLLVSDWCKRAPKIDHLKSLSLVPGIEVKLITIPPYSGGFIPFARVSHAKYMIVDTDRSWIGTSNWQKDYFHRSRNVGLIVESADVASTLKGIFEKDWSSRYACLIDPAEDYVPPKVDG